MLREGRRLFGTDGIRGVANTELTPDFVMELGRAAGESRQSCERRDCREGPGDRFTKHLSRHSQSVLLYGRTAVPSRRLTGDQ